MDDKISLDLDNLKQSDIQLSDFGKITDNFLDQISAPFERHEKMMEEMTRIILKSDSDSGDTKVHFSDKTNRLTCGRKSIKLSANSKEYYICKKLIKKDTADRKREWSFDVLSKSFSGTEEADNPKNIYFATNRLNRKIKDAFGIDDFFIYSTKEIRINPDYV